MLPPFPLLALALAATDPAVYHGRQNQTTVRAPRLEGQVTVDGVLDEPAWRQAALLTGFSQFSPVDGRPAEDSTEVLVWYSPTAIHFGIRAYESHGAVHATLADRDRIQADDYVEILLGTFNDRRQATVFAVNPLGVQSDGTVIAGTRGQTGYFGTQEARESTDLTADFVFQSRGRVTDWGYEVEVRVPFKSLRYQPDRTQSWGLNIVRRVQHSGYEDSWTPARRAAASFLSELGTLEGLTDLHRGLVLDVTPEATSRRLGRMLPSGRYDHETQSDLGGNVRWGVTNNLTMNATANPDFSQVEADAAQFQFDPRQALSFAEKRPFFLDGIEQFATPNRLIYTRSIVQPLGAVKFTGKVRGTGVAVLSAVDDTVSSRTLGHRPIYNLARLQRDLGSQSRAALVYTDKIDGDDYNRVAAADARFVLGEIYTLTGQVGGSRTRVVEASGATTTTAPIWAVTLARTGRRFGFQYSANGIDEDFVAAAGLIGRGGVANVSASHRLTTYGGQGALLESHSLDLVTIGTWKYSRFVEGRDALEKKLHLNNNVTLRGGWNVGASVLVEEFGYDDDLYANYFLERTAGSAVDTVPFRGTSRLPNLDYVFTLGTPQWPRFSASVFYLWGRDENFFEWASGDIVWATLDAAWRPTDKLRVNGTYSLTSVRRHGDGTLVSRFQVPRLKLEYQLARPVFVRYVGEYVSTFRDDLRDESRTGFPILLRQPDGTFARAVGFEDNVFRSDWLFSYTPTPGTVVYVGYSASLEEERAMRFRDLRRVNDGLFAKLSYLFRL